MVQCPLESDVYTLLWLLSRRKLEAHQGLLRARPTTYVEISDDCWGALYRRNCIRILRTKNGDIELLYHTAFRFYYIQYTVVQVFIEEASHATILRGMWGVGGFTRLCGCAVYDSIRGCWCGRRREHCHYPRVLFFEFNIQ